MFLIKFMHIYFSNNPTQVGHSEGRSDPIPVHANSTGPMIIIDERCTIRINLKKISIDLDSKRPAPYLKNLAKCCIHIF